jgi:hypothetical protein
MTLYFRAEAVKREYGKRTIFKHLFIQEFIISILLLDMTECTGDTRRKRRLLDYAGLISVSSGSAIRFNFKECFEK